MKFSQAAGQEDIHSTSAQLIKLKNAHYKRAGTIARSLLASQTLAGALAVGDHHGYGADWAEDKQAAEDAAMKLCTSVANGCNVVQWVCTTR